jgi:hypothetical protein
VKETIAQIRAALDGLERETENAEGAQDRALVSGFELPDIIRDVVDLLLPELKPYEAALYFYLLRHSIVETGAQHMRVSTRKLQVVFSNPHTPARLRAANRTRTALPQASKRYAVH